MEHPTHHLAQLLGMRKALHDALHGRSSKDSKRGASKQQKQLEAAMLGKGKEHDLLAKFVDDRIFAFKWSVPSQRAQANEVAEGRAYNIFDRSTYARIMLAAAYSRCATLFVGGRCIVRVHLLD